MQAIKKVYYKALNGDVIPFNPVNLQTYFPIKLSLKCFTTGPSDYDMASDQIYCPCGETLDWPSGVVADALKISKKHLRKVHGR